MGLDAPPINPTPNQNARWHILQLYVPVSNALGLGVSFRELEELAYKSLFPVTYSETARWHHDVRCTPLRGWAAVRTYWNTLEST